MTVIETADTEVVINACSDAVGRTLQDVVGNISFRDVVFAYPSRREQNVSSPVPRAWCLVPACCKPTARKAVHSSVHSFGQEGRALC